MWTTLIPLVLKYWRYLAGALVVLVIAVSIWTYGHRQYEQGYATRDAEAQEQLLAAREAALKEIAKRDAEAERARSHNAEVISDYHAQLDSLSADLDTERLLYRRLFAQTRSATAHHSLPEATSGSGAIETRETGSATEAADLLAAAASECRANTEQLDALISEIRPQL